MQRPVLDLTVPTTVELDAAATAAVECFAICALLCAAVRASREKVLASWSFGGASLADVRHLETRVLACMFLDLAKSSKVVDCQVSC